MIGRVTELGQLFAAVGLETWSIHVDLAAYHAPTLYMVLPAQRGRNSRVGC